jgi:hypothetical protein
MRVLKFEGPTREHYDILYEGLAATQTRGPDTRILGKVFIKLEDHGVLQEKVPYYKLQKDSASIILEDAEYELVKKLLDTVEWNGVGAKKAGALMEWLNGLPSETIKKVE